MDQPHSAINRAFRRCLWLTCLAGLAVVLSGSLYAQFEVKGGVFNDLSERPGGIPVGPGGEPSGEPAITPQFSNVVETSGSAGPISADSQHASRYPSSGAVVLERASIGTSFASGVPRYFLGDRMAPPSRYVSTSGGTVATDAAFWRAEPIRAGEIVTNPSGQPLRDATGMAIANTGGVIVPALAP